MDDKKIAVLGLGYVGLPLALGLSFSYNIKGFDVDNNRINQLRKGIDSTLEVDEKKLPGCLQGNTTYPCRNLPGFCVFDILSASYTFP